MLELPGYQIIKELGRGGMARVYLALHEGLDRHVAIKVMYPNLSADSTFSDRFLREARIVARLNHPNIITVFDVGVHKRFHYLAMEYLPGDTLGDKIKQGIAPRQALLLLKQIAMGVRVAHDKGFIHRDIKPENILFREDGTPVITDFGVARAEQSSTQMTEAGTIIGTPHYMSPEQAQGYEIKPNSDIYSLGIVFYEMLTGDVPYRADSTVAVMYKHVNSPIPELSGKLGIFQTLLNRLMAKTSDARYQGAGDIISDIELLEPYVGAEPATRIMPRPELPGQAATDSPEGGTKKITVTIRPASLFKLATLGAVVLFTIAGVFVFTSPKNAPQLTERDKAREAARLSSQARITLQRQQAEREQRARELAARVQAEKERAVKEQAAREQAAKELAARKKMERDRRAAEKQRLELAMREKVRQRQATERKINRLIASAETALQKNRLNDAYTSYQKILKIDARHKAAKKGIYTVAGRYLAMAEKRAESAKFEQADYYLRRAGSISPRHPGLASVQQKLVELKNRRAAEKDKTVTQDRQKQPASQESEDKSVRQRTFGGF